MNAEFLQKIQELQKNGDPYAMVTLANLRGHAPQEIGAKAVFSRNGLEAGTIGGGKLEAKVISLVKEKLNAGEVGKCELLQWNLQKDVGMTCGGEVTLFLEIFSANLWNIAIFGAGHVAQALARVLVNLPCRVSVYDNRPEWIARLPEGVVKNCVQNLPAEVPNLKPGTFIAIITQGHGTDLPVVKAALEWQQYNYVGVLGSPVKAIKIRNELKEMGISPAVIETLHSPMGLPIGNNTPEEIAISIAAQLIQERDRVTSSRA